MQNFRYLTGLFLVLFLTSSCQTDTNGWAKRIENADIKELTQILDSIYQKDQYYRQQLASTLATYGDGSEELQNITEIMQYTDESNLKVVSIILDKKGWLGINDVGFKANSCLFLVVQHADFKTQLRYLPMMREAAEKGDVTRRSLALLEDRVALRQGKKQIYGSQVGRDPKTGASYVLPLEEPDSVDFRRAEMGLGRLEDYLRSFGIEWNVEEYKKQLSETEGELF